MHARGAPPSPRYCHSSERLGDAWLILFGDPDPKPKPKPNPNPKPEQVLKGEEFRKYASELRGKTAQYKRMKQELAELRSEWGVLSRTQAILEGEAKKVAGSG